jgi:hypothetical protein
MTRPFRFIPIALIAFTLGACAAVPNDSPVVEQLDSETGATVARIGRPLELYRESLAQDATTRFAFIGPFETNQMGNRELFLWVAVPTESPAGAEPLTVEVDGQPLALGAPGRQADFAGLRTSPYKIPMPWSAMYYYKIDAAVVSALGEARTVTVRVSEAAKDGAVRTTFTAETGADPRLRDFAKRGQT